ncbi:hypothetical protein MHN79_20665, partial [Vibrio sp. Of14-4]|uniref:hypothetical protein n=1 Tax=Vibrio sp. Of14-4 TaxID=2724878 RepID=UPI001EF39015
VHYGYDAKGRLSKVTVDLSPQDKSITDGQVYTTTYTYQNADSYLLKRISQSNGSVLTFEYKEVAGTTRLSKIDDNGSVTVLDYNEKRANDHQLKITDATGQNWYYQHDEQGRLVKTKSPQVVYKNHINGGSDFEDFFSTHYGYDKDNNLTGVDEEDGRGAIFDYDAMGNCIKKEGRGGVGDEYYEYDDLNRLVKTRIDNRPGSDIDDIMPSMEYDGYRYAIYEGLNLRFEVTEAGLVTEHEYDGFGQRVRSREYTNSSLFQDSLPTVEAMIDWAKAQDKSETLLTDYTYQRGLLHTQVHYDTLDSDGNGIVKPNIDVVAASQEETGVWINGTHVGGVAPGITITHLNAKGQLVSSQTYDTFQDTIQSEELLLKLDQLSDLMSFGDKIYLSTSGQWHSAELGHRFRQTLQAETKLNLKLSGFDSSTTPQFSLPETMLLVFEKWDSTSAIDQMVLIDEQYVEQGSVSFHDSMQYTRFTYDAFGQLLNQDVFKGHPTGDESRLLSSTVNVYDGIGRIISQTDAKGVTTSTHYLDASRQVLVTQASGATVSRTYSAAGHVLSEVRSAPEQPHRERHFVYNELGQLIATQHPDGSARFQFYDAAGALWLTVSETGAVTEYQKDKANTRVEVQYQAIIDTSNWLVDGKLTLSGDSLLALIPDTDNPRVTMSYHDESVPYAHTSILTEYTSDSKPGEWYGFRTWMDNQGRPMIEAERSNDVLFSTYRTYHPSGEVALEQDRDGYVTEYKHQYSTYGKFTETRRYHQPTSVYRLEVPYSSYDVIAQTTYDSLGRIRFHRDESGTVTETRYLDGGRDKKVYLYDFDDLDYLNIEDFAWLAKSVVKAPTEWKYSLVLLSRERRDHAGRLLSSTDKYGAETRYVYDEKTGLLRQTITAANTSESRSEYRHYNGFGELTGKVVLEGDQDWQSPAVSELTHTKGTRSEFDVMGRKVRQYHPATGSTSYQYDKMGRLVSTTDAEGHTRSKEYNTYGEVSKILVDGVLVKSAEYDLKGRLHREVDREGVQTTYLYRESNRVSFKIRQHIDQVYNNLGDRTGREIARHVTQYGYDNRGNIIEQLVAKDYRAGNQISGGDTIDAVQGSRLKYVSQWQRKYDHRGRVVSETNGEGVERKTSYEFSGRVKEVYLSGAVQERIELDAMGRTLSLTNGAGEKTEYEYDDT